MSQSIKQFDVPKALPRRGPQWLARLCQWIFTRRGWQVEGEMPDTAKVIFSVAPHTSNWDFFIGLCVVFALRLDIRFFGKHTIFIGPLGWLMRKIGGIPIERSRAHGLVESVSSTIKSHEQMILAIAPEGTRSPIYPWKKGFLAIAQQAEIPVQCIGLDYARKRLVFGPFLQIGTDIEEQMQTIYAFYATVAAKYPKNVLLAEPKA